jgi:hypothetical protein
MLFLILLSFPAIAADVVADAPITNDAMKQLAIHAAAIAGFIRLVVLALRSPFLGVFWSRIPVPVRPVVLVLLGAVAAAFDSIALGTPIIESFFSAIGGIFGAVGSHEMQDRVIGKKK